MHLSRVTPVLIALGALLNNNEPYKPDPYVEPPQTPKTPEWQRVVHRPPIVSTPKQIAAFRAEHVRRKLESLTAKARRHQHYSERYLATLERIDETGIRVLQREFCVTHRVRTSSRKAFRHAWGAADRLIQGFTATEIV